jgi:hypothetical protein
MKCKSGRHEWADPIDAKRCCSAWWRREVRARGQEGDLDPEGRHVVPCEGTILVYGWAPTMAVFPGVRKDPPAGSQN